MANQAIEEAEEHIDAIDKAKQSESQTILQFLKENVNQWKQRSKDQGDDGENSKRNLFSQNDSEAQFIEQEPLSDDDEEDDDTEDMN